MRRRSEQDARRRTHGQNYLRGDRLAAQLVSDADIRAGDLVLEIGPGSGALTRHLAAQARLVIAIELAPMWARRLREEFRENPRVVVVEGDALRVPWPRERFRVVASLPFNITTAVLHRLLDHPESPLTRADLIVEWEVARKRASIDRGSLLNIGWQPWFEFHLSRRLNARLFRPVPQVDAAVLTIRRRARPLLAAADRSRFVGFVQAGYRGRGARLRQTMRPVLTEHQFWRVAQEWGFPPDATAPDLDVWQWLALFVFWRQARPD